MAAWRRRNRDSGRLLGGVLVEDANGTGAGSDQLSMPDMRRTAPARSLPARLVPQRFTATADASIQAAGIPTGARSDLCRGRRERPGHLVRSGPAVVAGTPPQSASLHLLAKPLDLALLAL